MGGEEGEEATKTFSHFMRTSFYETFSVTTLDFPMSGLALKKKL